jgi:uncharacterized protein (TIGR03663 family)
MKKVTFYSLFLAVLILALAFRLGRLNLRPMHHDEANQAVKFGILLETGEYCYDPSDHHGPTLYYATLPFAWLRGQKTLSALDEWTLRSVTALFGAGLILLFGLLNRGLGREAVLWSALFAAVSPCLTYYSRSYIQESLFAFIAMGFLIFLGRFALRPSLSSALATGVAAGLAYATKETSLIIFAAAGMSLAITLIWMRHSGQAAVGDSSGRGIRLSDLLTMLAAAASLGVILFSSFFKNPWGIIASLGAFNDYATRGIEAGVHAHPWYYYLQILSFSKSGGMIWSEALILIFALIGASVAVGHRPTHRCPSWFDAAGSQFWPRYLACYSLLTATTYSAIRYKTPWNLLAFVAGFTLLAGSGAAAVLHHLRGRLIRRLFILVALAGCFHLGYQSWRANYLYPADARNPYAYAQTSPDFLRLSQRIHDLSGVHQDGSNMLVKVVAGPYEQWPLPWYLRDMPRVGYWLSPEQAGGFDGVPVIVASQEHAATLETTLGNRYQFEYFGLRPNALLALFIERTLWDQYLSRK